MAALTLYFCPLDCALTCCLPSSQIESMMLKLQRLQQKAVLDDDYDAGEPPPPTPPMGHFTITEAAPCIKLLLFMTQGHAGFRESL